MARVSGDMFYVLHQFPSETRTISGDHHVQRTKLIPRLVVVVVLVCERHPLETQTNNHPTAAAIAVAAAPLGVPSTSSDRSEKCTRHWPSRCKRVCTLSHHVSVARTRRARSRVSRMCGRE